MLSPQLFNSLELEIVGVNAEIQRHRATLEAEEDRLDAEGLRVQIRYLQRHADKLKATREELKVSAGAVAELPAKWRRWRDACCEAREGQELVRSLDQKLAEAREACNSPLATVAAAENALGRLRATPLPEYPTERERRAKKAAEDELQKEYDSALSHLRDVAQVREGLERELLNARVEFDRRAFKERMCRLPAEPAPFQSPGNISHVA